MPKEIISIKPTNKLFSERFIDAVHKGRDKDTTYCTRCGSKDLTLIKTNKKGAMRIKYECNKCKKIFD